MSAQLPSVGRMTHYYSERNDGVYSPATVLRTQASTIPGVIENWDVAGENTLSGKGRPPELVPILPNPMTVDLLVNGLGGDFRRYAVPFSPEPKAGHWSWPVRA